MLIFQGSWKNEYAAKGNEVALLGLKVSVCSVMPSSLRHPRLWPARLLRPWDAPGKNTGVGCHFLLQGNLPDPWIESVSLCLLHLWVDSLPGA